MVKLKQKKKIKKVIAILMTAIIIIAFCSPFIISKADELDAVEVYITVSDITDYTQPINILVPRQKISVSNFNLANFGNTMTGITCIEGITYLHALTQLHRNLYGDEQVSNNLMLTPEGVTKIFMGKSVANVMYKNGRDIFALPQLINIKDGDEIQVCLYDEGHSQAIATFNEAIVEDVSPHEKVNLTLQQHYGFPRDRDALSDMEIITEDGVYLTDKYGEIITTDDKGNFSVSFSEEGSYTISAMPSVNYYMSDTGGGIKVEWVPQTVIKEVEYKWTEAEYPTSPPYCYVYGEYDGSNGGISAEDGRKIYEDMATHIGVENIDILVFDWESGVENGIDNAYSFLTNTDNGVYTEKSEIRLEEVTELVRVEKIVPDLLEPMVTYTTPFVTINVTTDLIIEDVYLQNANLYVETKNSEYHSEHDMYIAGYSITESGGEKLEECKKFTTIQEQHRAAFYNVHDIYKIFVWQDGTMTPIMSAECFNPNEPASVAVLEYDYTLPLPDNIYTTQ